MSQPTGDYDDEKDNMLSEEEEVYDEDDIFAELAYYANQYDHDPTHDPIITLIAPVAPYRAKSSAFSYDNKIESLYTSAPP